MNEDSGALLACPIPVVRLEYDDDGNEQHWTEPAPCGASLYLQQTAVADLDWLWANHHDAEQLSEIDLREEWDTAFWEVRCENGHVISMGSDE